MLEDVDVQLALCQCQIRAHIVGNSTSLTVYPFSQRRLDLVFDHIAEVADRCTEDDFFFLRAVLAEEAEAEAAGALSF